MPRLHVAQFVFFIGRVTHALHAITADKRSNEARIVPLLTSNAPLTVELCGKSVGE
jgi:hypothetical protein